MSTCEATFFLARRSSTAPYVFFITNRGEDFLKTSNPLTKEA